MSQFYFVRLLVIYSFWNFSQAIRVQSITTICPDNYVGAWFCFCRVNSKEQVKTVYFSCRLSLWAGPSQYRKRETEQDLELNEIAQRTFAETCSQQLHLETQCATCAAAEFPVLVRCCFFLSSFAFSFFIITANRQKNQHKASPKTQKQKIKEKTGYQLDNR